MQFLWFSSRDSTGYKINFPIIGGQQTKILIFIPIFIKKLIGTHFFIPNEIRYIMSTMVITSKVIYILRPNVLCDEDHTELLSLQGIYNEYPIIIDKLDAISLSNNGNCIKLGVGSKTKKIEVDVAYIVQFTWNT